MPISITQRQRAWSTLTSGIDDALTAAKNIGAAIENLRDDSRYADDYKTGLIEQQKATLTETLAKSRQDIDAARETLLTGARELSTPQGDATAQLLAETRQQRAWERIKPQLDAGRNWRKVLDDAVATRDGAALVALRQEMPAYAQAQRKPERGMAALADTPLNLDDMHHVIDAAIYRVLGDDQGHGAAAALRLHVAARYPVAVAKLDQAGDVRPGTDRLAKALTVNFAEKEAARIEALFSEPDAA